MGGPQVNENSPARWKSAFLTLPDAAFFDILRNYLGDIKSPFNKHNLLESLEAFLRRPDTRESLTTLIDEEDGRLLTALYLLDAPTHEELYRFFEGDIGYLDLHHKLLNLQDRLLVYADRKESGEEILINPLLEGDLLAAGVVDIGLLIPSEKVKNFDYPVPWFSDSLLTALLAFLVGEGDFSKSDGGLKKKTEAELRKKIPLLFPDEEGSKFAALFAGLGTAGLLRRGEGGKDLDIDAWKDFANLTEEARACILLRCSREEDIFKAWREAEFLVGFLGVLEKDRAYSKDALVKLGRLLAHRSATGLAFTAAWIDGLAAFDALVPADGGTFVPNPRFPARARTAGEEAGIILQPNFEIAAKPDLSLREGLVLAVSASLQKFDQYPQYELTKASFARALSLGFHGRNLALELERLSANKAPQNISFSLEVWEREYGSIALYEGVVLTVDEDRRHLVEHLEELKRYLRLRLAPGVFLTDREALPECRRILKAAGIELFPRVRRSDELPGDRGLDGLSQGEAEEREARQKTLFDLPEPGPRELLPPRGTVLFPRGFTPVLQPGSPRLPETERKQQKTYREKAAEAEKLLQAFERKLEETALPEDQARELEERIRKRLVLVPDQLRPDTGRKEKSEAKGLDYVGKVLVIEQTLKNPSSYLEIILRSADGAPTRVLARPRELKKTGTDLVLLAMTIPEDKALEIQVKKISLVRRLRGFLMG